MTNAGSRVRARQSGVLAVDVLAGTLAPPSANGELVFASPHEARLFGMAHSLVHAGVFDWDTFRAALIVAIAAAAADADAGPTPAASLAVKPAVGQAPAYYHCFAQALVQLLAERNLIRGDELSARTQRLAERPSDHDHDHDHDHDEEFGRGS